MLNKIHMVKRMAASVVAVGVLSLSAAGVASAAPASTQSKQAAAMARELKHFNCATAQKRIGYQGRLLASTEATIAGMTKLENAANAAAAAATNPAIAARDTTTATYWGKAIARQQKHENHIKNSARMTAMKARISSLYAAKCVTTTTPTTTAS